MSSTIARARPACLAVALVTIACAPALFTSMAQAAASGAWSALTGSRSPATPRASSARLSRGAATGAAGPASRGPARSPSLPPLTAPGQPAGEGPSEGEPTAEGDPLVGNGLASPSCRPPLRERLSPPAAHDCAASGFVATPVPTQDYGIDVHVGSGSGLLGGLLLGAMQDYLVVPPWTVLVWSVHALVVMLEWAFSLELLGGLAASQIVGELLGAQRSVTWPWLGLALALGSIALAYDGLVRRRVAHAVGGAAATTAMIAGGLWLIADPSATVGTLSAWSSQVGLGALSVTTHAGSRDPQAALGESTQALFATAVQGPWCYLEFGDVGWCEDPSRRDPRLRAAALHMAGEEMLESVCALPTGDCRQEAHALRQSALSLRSAPSNGAIFLALPANAPARNSIESPTSLLRALCQSSDVTSCRGPTAAQAEFRTAAGTVPRLAGLAGIALGLAGMLMLLGFMAVRLLTAATQTLVYLLMAPAAVLAPALGEWGRTLFRDWSVRLFGAVVSKLLFSLLLGIVLAVSAVLARLQVLGWLTQWLLLSAFWWTVFLRRHHLLAGVGPRARGAGRPSIAVARRGGHAFERVGMTAVLSRLRDRDERPPPKAGPRERPWGAAAREWLDERRQAEDPDSPALRMLTHARESDTARLDATLAALGAQRDRIGRAREAAISSGERRRALRLAHRRMRVDESLEHERRIRDRAEVANRNARPVLGPRGIGPSAAALDERERFLAAQAVLPEAAKSRGATMTRDYPELAPLLGYGAARYRALDPGAKRRARLEIDRQLRARRAKALDVWPELEHAFNPPPPRAPSTRPPVRRRKRRKPGEPPAPLPPLDEHASQDPVMCDLWAYLARDKRALGIGWE